jgi:hypothetical protein
MPGKKTPRQAIYQSFKGSPGICPRCNGKLVNERKAFAVATRKGGQSADSFIITGDFGWFCRSCPTVVINGDRISEMLRFQKSGWNTGSEYTVLGIVDLDAIPPSKRHLPLGHPNNPVPLVEFHDVPQSPNRKHVSEPSESTKRPMRRRKSRKQN